MYYRQRKSTQCFISQFHLFVSTSLSFNLLLIMIMKHCYYVIYCVQSKALYHLQLTYNF